MSRTAVKRGLYGKLAGDTTLTNLLGTAAPGYSKAIYYEQAPEGADFPFVLISRSASTPTYSFQSGKDAFKADVWQVKAITRDTLQQRSADTAEAIADRIETLLLDASLSISGRSLLYLRPESELDYAEVVDGVTYRHAGSDYRLMHA